MPILGLIVLLVLLFLRREFVPSQPTQVEGRSSESPEGPGIVPAETPVDNPADAAVLADLFPEEAKNQKAETKIENPEGPGVVPAATPTEIPKADPSVAIDSNRTQSAAVETTRLTTNAAAALPSATVVEPPPKAWPAFTLTGIAVGRERLAILSTGEMLLAGEMSKCGVRVEKVNGASVVFSFGGETKTLRKGEHSDKPADPR
jgi:hypothetical protein